MRPAPVAVEELPSGGGGSRGNLLFNRDTIDRDRQRRHPIDQKVRAEHLVVTDIRR
jgi:hypothetical protein